MSESPAGWGEAHCVTCSDEAVVAEVVAVDGLEAVVQVGDGQERVAIDLVPEAVAGDVLLCHAGIALEPVRDTVHHDS